MAIASVHPTCVPALIGRSSAIESLRSLIQRLAAVPVNAVITGESGTGKQLVARAIHAQANRMRPFVLVDCPSISEKEADTAFLQLTSDLDGARRSASERVEAEGGTLFLRNIEHLGPFAQAKLSRIVQSEVKYEAKALSTHVRVIASAQKDLRELCDRGAFLPDLYYSLSIVNLATVPLRAIREDIPLLLDAFLSDAANTHGRDVPTLVSVMPYLLSHKWPGNARELRNFALRLVLGFNGDGSPYDQESRPSPLAQQVSWFEKQIIVQQLRTHGGSVEAASESLAVPKTTLYEKMQKYSISTRAFRSADACGAAPALREVERGSCPDQKP
jgi:two-component system C4-dicarboxylate transport response regulator DctD